MVKIYSAKVGTPTNKQHSEILNWLEKSEIFKDCYVFLEFQITGGRKRQIDLVILQEDRICLLELKGRSFTKILVNDNWYYWNEKQNKEVELIKKIKGLDENPYMQACNSANNFKKWIRGRKFLCGNLNFKKFLLSPDFAVFPIVYISNTDMIIEPEMHNWCFLAKGKDDLERNLRRIWKSDEEKPPKLSIDFIESLADALHLSSTDLARRGRDNQTLISILNFLYKNSPKWKTEDQIKDDVFRSGGKKISQVRKAIIRGKKEGVLIIDDDGFFQLSHLLKICLDESLTVEDIYERWLVFRRFDDARFKNHDLFMIYINDLNSRISVDEGTNNITDSLPSIQSIPDSLLIYDFKDIIRYQESKSPEFFRSGGPIWADFQKDTVIPFYTSDRKNLTDLIIEGLNEGKNFLIVGKASTGKTTLTRWLGLSLIKNNLSVISLTPNELDLEAIRAILNYEKEPDLYSDTTLFIVIENVHLATGTELNWIKQLLRSLKRIKIILTSRTDKLYINDEDIFEIFSKEDDFSTINLMDEVNLADMAEKITFKYISGLLKGVSDKNISKIVEKMLKRNDNNFILLKIEIEAAIQYSKVKGKIETSRLEKILNDTTAMEPEIRKQVLLKFDNIKQLVFRETNTPLKAVTEILYLIFHFGFLEITVHSSLISKFIDTVSQEEIQNCLNFLERNGEILSNEGGYIINHPIYAKKMVEAIESDKDFKEEIKEIQLNLANSKGDTTSDKVANKLFKISPGIRSEWRTFRESEILHTSEDVIRLSSELTTEDFVRFIRSIYFMNTWTFYTWWEIWEDVGIENLMKLVKQAGTLRGVFNFLEFLHDTKWPKFSTFISKIEPEFFLQMEFIDYYDLQDSLLHYFKKWNYPGIAFFEVELILQDFLASNKKNPFYRYNISLNAIEKLNSLNPDKFFNIIREDKVIFLRSFLSFLKGIEKRSKAPFTLHYKIVAKILEDSLRSTSISTFCLALENITYDEIQKNSEFLKIIENWDINELHDILLEVDAGWFRFMLHAFKDWNTDVVNNLIESFSIKDMAKIVENEDVDGYEDSFNRLPELLNQLKKSGWNKLSDLLDYYGSDYFINYLYDESEFYGNTLIDLLLEINWNQKTTFIHDVDFFKWVTKKKSYAYVKNLIKKLISLKIPGVESIIKHFFLLETNKEWISIELKNLLDLCNENGWKWKEWIDIRMIESKIQESSIDGFRFIELLEEYGWSIPVNLEHEISDPNLEDDKNLWDKMSQIERAGYLYFAKDKKNEAIQLYSEIAKKIDFFKNNPELNRLSGRIKRLPKKIGRSIIALIPPTQPSIIQDNETLRNCRRSLFTLNEFEYPHLPHTISLLFLMTPKNYEGEFWREIKILHLSEEQTIELFNELWNTNNFEKVSRLPSNYHKYLQSKIHDMLVSLNLSVTEDPFLWEIISNVYLKHGNKSDEEFCKFISLIFNSVEKIDTLKALMQYFPGKKHLILQIFYELSVDQIKLRMLKANLWTIIQIFQILENEDCKEEIDKLILIINEKDWKEKLDATEWQYWPLISLWLIKHIPNLKKYNTNQHKSQYQEFI